MPPNNHKQQIQKMMTDDYSPVITCRKLKPKVHASLWCRSCTLNLKKRCTGVHDVRSDEKNKTNSFSVSRKRSRSDDLGAAKVTKPMELSMEEKWVQCEGCDSWRRLPDSVDLSILPEKWYCNMNIWDELGNKCLPSSCRQAEKNSIRPASAQDFGSEDRFKLLLSQASSTTSQLITPKPEITLTQNSSLVETLGLKTVEKVKELCRQYGVRTTRAGTNGGRKSKGELIGDLLQAGLTHIDEAFELANPSTTKARRRRSPLQFPNKTTENTLADGTPKLLSQSPLFAAAAAVEARDAPRGLDSLAEVACLALGLSPRDQNSLDAPADFPSPCSSPKSRAQPSQPPQWILCKPFNESSIEQGFRKSICPLSLPPNPEILPQGPSNVQSQCAPQRAW